MESESRPELESVIFLESESELKSLRFCRFRSGIAGYPVNRHKEKESGSVEIKLKRHLVMEFRPDNGFWR